jgi:hypothetical protein
VERWNLEADLRSQEEWRAILHNELRNATTPSHHNSIASQLPGVEDRIAELRDRLESDP